MGPPPFKPSRIAAFNTVIPDRGAFGHVEPVDGPAQPGQPVDRRNPLYKTTAERLDALPPFLANRNPYVRESAKDYVVLPGGDTVYFGGADKRLVPFGPSDWPPHWHNTDPPDSSTRITRLPSRPIPSDQQFAGHYTSIDYRNKPL